MQSETGSERDERASAKVALVVIDLQTDMFESAFMPPVYDADGLVERTRAMLDWARRSGHKIGFVRHDGPPGDPLAPGEPGWPLYEGLGRLDGEPIFSKRVGDAFSEPEIGAWLEKNGIDTVVFVGAQSDFCVNATVRGALARGLNVTVVSDGHSTWDLNGETAADIIARHNREFAQAGATLVDSGTLTSAAPVAGHAPLG